MSVPVLQRCSANFAFRPSLRSQLRSMAAQSSDCRKSRSTSWRDVVDRISKVIAMLLAVIHDINAVCEKGMYRLCRPTSCSVASPLRKFSSYLYNTLDNRVHKPLQSLNHQPQAMIALEICRVLITQLSVKHCATPLQPIYFFFSTLTSFTVASKLDEKQLRCESAWSGRQCCFSPVLPAQVLPSRCVFLSQYRPELPNSTLSLAVDYRALRCVRGAMT